MPGMVLIFVLYFKSPEKKEKKIRGHCERYRKITAGIFEIRIYYGNIVSLLASLE